MGQYRNKPRGGGWNNRQGHYGAGKNRIASKRSRSWRCHVDASAASLRLRWQSAKFFLKVHAMMK